MAEVMTLFGAGDAADGSEPVIAPAASKTVRRGTAGQ
jgi:hypothetical protein